MCGEKCGICTWLVIETRRINISLALLLIRARLPACAADLINKLTSSMCWVSGCVLFTNHIENIKHNWANYPPCG